VHLIEDMVRSQMIELVSRQFLVEPFRLALTYARPAPKYLRPLEHGQSLICGTHDI
jgi:hypothetical protein